MLRNVVSPLTKFHRRSKTVYSSLCDAPLEMLKYLQCRKDIKLDMCIIDENMVDPSWSLPEIVIIGGGIAGLSAGQRLVASGLTKFTIIEATHRAGGRIHSSMFGDVPVEIGATYIEGASLSNCVYTLASQESLITKPPIRQDSFSGMAFTSDGHDIPQYIAEAAQESFYCIVNRAANLYVTKKDSEDYGILAEYLIKQIDEAIKPFPCNYRDFASRVMLSEMVGLKNRCGNCLHEVCAKHFGNYIDLSGGRVRVASGMVGVLAPLLRAMPECESIRYCKPVTKVEYSAKIEYEDSEKTKPRPRAKVYCCDGHVFSADYVIVTLPLGVLQKNMDSLFSPGLPETKRDSIKRLGYGHMNNVYFEYSKPFWVWREGRIRPCWRLDELTEGLWVNGIEVIEEVPTSQQILSVTLSHNAAQCVEQLSEVQLAEDFTSLLRKFLHDPTLPYPANVLRTKWSSCPYSLGAKTFIKYGSTHMDICEYGRTVPEDCESDVPVLLFAGEGTVMGAYGSMHGARMSGIREAERIVNYTKKFQGKPRLHPESVCVRGAVTG